MAISRLRFQAGILAAAAVLLAAPALAITDTDNVTINSDKHNTKPTDIRTLPPSDIPPVEQLDQRRVPVSNDRSIVPRTGGANVSDAHIDRNRTLSVSPPVVSNTSIRPRTSGDNILRNQVDRTRNIGQTTTIDAVSKPPTTGGASGR